MTQSSILMFTTFNSSYSLGEENGLFEGSAEQNGTGQLKKVRKMHFHNIMLEQECIILVLLTIYFHSEIIIMISTQMCQMLLTYMHKLC